MSNLQLQWLEGEFVVYRFSAETPIPPQFLSAETVSITRTSDELSIVAPALLQANAPKSEAGWVMFKFVGTLDFSLTGILSGIATPLAKAGVSIFAISTFDTDYVMVKADQKKVAQEILRSAGYKFS